MHNIIFRDPVFDGAADPTVIRRASDGRYFMFYTQRRASLECSGVEWAHGTRIGVAVCDADPFGCAAGWRYAGTAELPFTEGKTTYWAPEVIYDGESYRMFVSSVDGVYAEWAGNAEILQFVSPDLEKWTPLGAVPIESARVIDACAFPLPAGGWRLWYKDEKRGSHTFYIDTRDFREWRAGGEATSDTDQEGPNVFALGGRYWLVADVWNGLAVYSSDDLTDFTRAGEDLLPGAASHADVFVEDGRARLVYFCYPEGDRRSAVACCELVVDGEGLKAVFPL